MKVKFNTKILISGEHFSYVVIHLDMTFDLYDRKLNLTKGKKMEFVDVVKELDKELNLYHYYEKTIIDLYIQFIIYDKKYKPFLISRIM